MEISWARRCLRRQLDAHISPMHGAARFGTVGKLPEPQNRFLTVLKAGSTQIMVRLAIPYGVALGYIDWEGATTRPRKLLKTIVATGLLPLMIVVYLPNQLNKLLKKHEMSRYSSSSKISSPMP